MGSPLTVAQVRALDRAEFVAAFGGVFEDSPALAASVWEHGPYADRQALMDAFRQAAADLGPDEALGLLRAHPQLGSTAPMGRPSTAEQRSVGLDRIDHELRERLALDNARYLERFGFPFIIAVRGRTLDEIVDELARRLTNDPAAERATAFAQVQEIARLRLDQLVEP